MEPFAKTLTEWYLKHRRDLPWRDTRDPYPIWLSEIILQQTRVAQGLPYFLRFTESFPNIRALADADEETILRHWQGLGYYSRARNLHAAAKFVSGNLGGKFPGDYESLRRLKGVGDYTAAAIASFAYGEAVPVVDGNVFRVLSRYFGIETDIATPVAKKQFRALARELMPKSDAATFNQAIMEFGALQCVPKSPDCGVCPFNGSCVALKKRIVSRLPVKSKKAKSKDRFLHYLVLIDESGNTSIRKRSENDIWHNLYEFPMVETNMASEPDDALKRYYIDEKIKSIKPLPHFETVHKLTHQNLHIRFSEIAVEGLLDNGIPPAGLAGFAMPAVLVKFAEKHWK